MNHEITLSEAVAMTTRFRSYKESILKTEYQNEDILPVCETFEKLSVEALLSQGGATHLRIYYGMDSEYKVHAILVGADSTGADILPEENSNLLQDPTGVILEDAQRCPPYCPPTSPLNDD